MPTPSEPRFRVGQRVRLTAPEWNLREAHIVAFIEPHCKNAGPTIKLELEPGRTYLVWPDEIEPLEPADA